jgi:hypothetical protein
MGLRVLNSPARPSARRGAGEDCKSFLAALRGAFSAVLSAECQC